MKLSKQQETVITWSAITAGLLLVSYAVYEVFFKKTTVSADLASLKAQGIVPTITDTNAQGYADSLDGWFSNSILMPEQQVLDIFQRCANLADVLLIIEKFDKHFYFSFSYFGNYTLPEMMTKIFDDKFLNKINSMFQLKNINYKF